MRIKVPKEVKNTQIVMTATITIHEFYFDIYADSTVNYVVELSCISNITLREIQVSNSLLRMTVDMLQKEIKTHLILLCFIFPLTLSFFVSEISK